MADNISIPLRSVYVSKDMNGGGEIYTVGHMSAYGVVTKIGIQKVKDAGQTKMFIHVFVEGGAHLATFNFLEVVGVYYA